MNNRRHDRYGTAGFAPLALFSVAVVAFLGATFPVAAESFTTECPREHPNKPEKTFRFAQMLHGTDGSWAAGDREMILENGDEHWIERHPKDQWWFHRAVLSCFYSSYKEGIEFRMPIPGVLREYHVVYRFIRTQSSLDKVSIRAWAVSADDPLSESPPGKLIPPQ